MYKRQAYDWSDIEAEAKAAGVTAFCPKPMFLSDLRGSLMTAIGQKPEAVSYTHLDVYKRQGDGRRVFHAQQAPCAAGQVSGVLIPRGHGEERRAGVVGRGQNDLGVKADSLLNFRRQMPQHLSLIHI